MTHVTRILSTTDFSEQSRHAMDYAVALARSWSARLTVLHVHQLAPPLLAGPYLGSESALPVSLTPDERRELSHAMASFVASDRSAGVEVETRLQEDFLVPRAILECAAAEQAGLVVLGTHGRSGFERLALGSVAERVLRTSVVPVLTVPPRAGGADRRAPLAIQAVVCPLDFGPSSAGALDMAASLAERTRAGLTVVHVVDLAGDAPEPMRQEFIEYRTKRFEDARSQLQEAIPESVRRSTAVRELVLVGKPYREIVRLASEQEADIIVMGVQGRGAVDLLFFGSTANHVVRQAPCPVLTVRG